MGEVIRALGQNPTEAEVKRLVQDQKKGDRVRQVKMCFQFPKCGYFVRKKEL